MFVALPKTDEARVVGKQGLRWGTSVGANCCSRYRSRFKVEFISKIGDGLKELDETVYWLELLIGSRFVSSPKQTSLQDETNQPLVILTMLGAFDLGVLGELGASRFAGPKRVRAKDAKDAKVRKVVTELSLRHTVWWACGWRGLPGSVSPATTEAVGGRPAGRGLLS